MCPCQEWKLRLTYMMMETLAGIRTSDMFDMVVDYPSSQPAIEDLAYALQHTNMTEVSYSVPCFKSHTDSMHIHIGLNTHI